MKLNAYPSQIFIGDTYCYFAGIIIAISALMSKTWFILGGTAIVCHMFLIPQLINFLYSTPQLFGFVPCPRHRLTTYNKEKDTLHPKDENMNLLNLSLRIIGPTNEGKLCSKLLIFQILTSSIPVLIRLFSWLFHMFKDLECIDVGSYKGHHRNLRYRSYHCLENQVIQNQFSWLQRSAWWSSTQIRSSSR